MSSEEKIIITTEEISVDELKGREKQIYDYAYRKGCSIDEAYRRDRLMRVAIAILLTVVAVSFFILIWKATPQ